MDKSKDSSSLESILLSSTVPYPFGQANPGLKIVEKINDEQSRDEKEKSDQIDAEVHRSLLRDDERILALDELKPREERGAGGKVFAKRVW